MSTSTTPNTLNIVAKLRWTRKKPEQPMTIKNFEGLRLMCSAILAEKSGQIQEANMFEAKAINELERENRDYLSGIKHPITTDTDFGFGDIGYPL